MLFLFLKVLLPFSLLLYVSLSFFTNLLLEKSFGGQAQVISVRVEKNGPSEIRFFSYGKGSGFMLKKSSLGVWIWSLVYVGLGIALVYIPVHTNY